MGSMGPQQPGADERKRKLKEMIRKLEGEKRLL